MCLGGKYGFFVNDYIGGNYLESGDLWKTMWKTFGKRGFWWVFVGGFWVWKTVFYIYRKIRKGVGEVEMLWKWG